MATLKDLMTAREGETSLPPEFGAIMELAGQLRPTDPNEGARLDRYAQGISTARMPGFRPAVDIPVNLALATAYEGVKALPEWLGNPILERLDYGRKASGQATSDASLANILALYEGLKR